MTSRFTALTLSALAGLGGMGSLAAADRDDYINDVRVAFGFSPDYEVEGASEDVEGAWRLGVEYFRSLERLEDTGGWLWGGELSYTGADDNGTEVTQLALTGFFGYAYALRSWPVHVEGTPFIGVGTTNVDAGGTDDDDTYMEWGLRAAGFYSFANAWQVGIDLRALFGSTSPDFGAGSTDFDNEGLAAAVVVGYRL
jgi:hypothetical protein